MKCIGRTSQIILLFVVVLITGCGADGPAQFVDATNDMENWEVYFDKIPEDVTVSGAKEYGVDGTTLRIVALSCKTDIVVSWVGGQKTFEYDCPPNQIRRPKPVEDAVDTSEEDANGPPRATRATVELTEELDGEYPRWTDTIAKEVTCNLIIRCQDREGNLDSESQHKITVFGGETEIKRKVADYHWGYRLHHKRWNPLPGGGWFKQGEWKTMINLEGNKELQHTLYLLPEGGAA